jgi:hypothetical protein
MLQAKCLNNSGLRRLQQGCCQAGLMSALPGSRDLGSVSELPEVSISRKEYSSSLKSPREG